MVDKLSEVYNKSDLGVLKTSLQSIVHIDGTNPLVNFLDGPSDKKHPGMVYYNTLFLLSLLNLIFNSVLPVSTSPVILLFCTTLHHSIEKRSQFVIHVNTSF